MQQRSGDRLANEEDYRQADALPAAEVAHVRASKVESALAQEDESAKLTRESRQLVAELEARRKELEADRLRSQPATSPARPAISTGTRGNTRQKPWR